MNKEFVPPDDAVYLLYTPCMHSLTSGQENMARFQRGMKRYILNNYSSRASTFPGLVKSEDRVSVIKRACLCKILAFFCISEHKVFIELNRSIFTLMLSALTSKT